MKRFGILVLLTCLLSVTCVAQIGSLKTFDDGTQGIVFYEDGNGHGLVISTFKNTIWFQWQKNNNVSIVPGWRQCVDIDSIPNEKNYNRRLEMGLGKKYTDAIIAQLGKGQAPAAEFCRCFGPEWYLPSAGELWQLIVVANQGNWKKGPISKALKEIAGCKLGASSLTNNACFCSSSEDDNTDIWALTKKGKCKNEEKYAPVFVTPIRMF